MNILYLAPIPHLATMPTGFEPIRAFLKRGHCVYLCSFRHCAHPIINILDKNLMIDYINYENSDFAKLKMSMWTLPRTLLFYREHNCFDVIIALSQLGLIHANFVWGKNKIPIVYLADEIRESGAAYNLKRIYKNILKILEISANKRVLFSVTQDVGRADLLAQVNKISKTTIRTLPNSGAGRSMRLKSQYIQDRYAIDNSKIVLLTIGMISPLNRSLGIVNEALLWPEDHVLVIHNRYDQSGEPYYESVNNLVNGSKIILSRKPVSFEELDLLVSSATIGLALYSNENKNMATMGYSSGKLNYYLKNGIPVIVQSFDSLRWVEETGCGICVSDPSGISSAIKLILKDYDKFSSAALETFNNRLSFDTAFDQLCVEIENAINAKIAS
jgi:hypothetical protein